MFLIGYYNHDYDYHHDSHSHHDDDSSIYTKLSTLPLMGCIILLFSCVVGTLIGYTGWMCRELISATSYTLVGVVNKFITILLNVLVWDKHSSAWGILSVCVCLIAGSMYEQAPQKAEAPQNSRIDTVNSTIATTISTTDSEYCKPEVGV